jgi:hypothetical protein
MNSFSQAMTITPVSENNNNNNNNNNNGNNSKKKKRDFLQAEGTDNNNNSNSNEMVIEKPKTNKKSMQFKFCLLASDIKFSKRINNNNFLCVKTRENLL